MAPTIEPGKLMINEDEFQRIVQLKADRDTLAESLEEAQIELRRTTADLQEWRQRAGAVGQRNQQFVTILPVSMIYFLMLSD
jgi:hypothetical protein